MIFTIQYQKYCRATLHTNSAFQYFHKTSKSALPIFHRPWPSLAKRPVGKSEGERVFRLAEHRTPAANSDAVRSAANFIIRTLTKSYCYLVG